MFFRIVSLSCSPSGAAFVCSAAASKKSVTSPLRLSQSFSSKYSEISSLTANSASGCAGVLQCWDMKAMKVEVWSVTGAVVVAIWQGSSFMVDTLRGKRLSSNVT